MRGQRATACWRCAACACPEPRPARRAFGRLQAQPGLRMQRRVAEEQQAVQAASCHSLSCILAGGFRPRQYAAAPRRHASCPPARRQRPVCMPLCRGRCCLACPPICTRRCPTLPYPPPPPQVGLNAHRVLDRREWRRLVTAPLLHADLPHLVSNCTGLVLEGLPLERRLGPLRFAALLASCAAVSQGLYGGCRAGGWGPSVALDTLAARAGQRPGLPAVAHHPGA